MASSIQGLNGILPDQQIDLANAGRISGTEAAANTAEAASAPSSASSASTTSDATDISALSATLANAVAAASAKSPIRPPIVSAIKAQIAAGMYGPDLSSVAAAIVRALSA
jgi:anti-sigma28 factor (negative regulator of flagellin synthesis)